VALTGFGLLISAATALGRACYAMEFAQSSRYVPYLIPAFLGVYLRVAASRPVRPRTAAMAAILVSAATAAMWLGPQDRAILHWLSDSKRAWRACYLQREDIRGCDAAANFVLLPTPEQFHMREKMEFLKRNRLNLYAP
jgi:hypothetical protein